MDCFVVGSGELVSKKIHADFYIGTKKSKLIIIKNCLKI